MIVFYGDGTTFEGDPKDAPRLNVQALLTKDHSTPAYNVRWLVLHEWDYYIYGKGRWYGVNGYERRS